MDLEQRLRESLVARKPGGMFTAKVLARVARGATQRRSRFVLIGTVLVVGAAASTLAWRIVDMRAAPVGSTAVPTVSEARPVAEESVVPAIREDGEPVVAEPESTASTAGMSPRYSVLVMPLRQESQNVSGRGAVEELYASMLDELRAVPGLTLFMPGESAPGAGGGADYVLTLTSLATRVSQLGGVVVKSTDGATMYTAVDGNVSTATSRGDGTLTITGGGLGSITGAGSNNPETAVWVEMKVESWQPATSRTTTLLVGAEGTAGQGRCNAIDGSSLVQSNSGPAGDPATYGSGAMAGVVNLVLNRRLEGVRMDMDYGVSEIGRPQSMARETIEPEVPQDRQPRPQECLTRAQLAAAQIETLRLQVFPPDSAFQQRVLARLGESGQDQAVESKIFSVLQGMMGERGARLDTGTIQALVRLAAGRSAPLRRNIWGLMRWTPVTHPALVAPLIESLRDDPDQQVRLAALGTLEANFSTHPLVRGTLETIGRQEPDSVVREAALMVLHGEARWRRKILAALEDTSLPYEGRLAPLLPGEPALLPGQQEKRLAALQDQQVLRPLIALVRQHLQDSARTHETRNVLTLLASVEDPAVFDLFLYLLRETPALQQETTEQPHGINVSGPVSAWAMNHRTDPRVLASLGNADPRLRTMLAQSVDQDSAPAPAVAAPPIDENLLVVPSMLIQRMKEVTEGSKPVASDAR